MNSEKDKPSVCTACSVITMFKVILRLILFTVGHVSIARSVDIDIDVEDISNDCTHYSKFIYAIKLISNKILIVN